MRCLLNNSEIQDLTVITSLYREGISPMGKPRHQRFRQLVQFSQCPLPEERPAPTPFHSLSRLYNYGVHIHSLFYNFTERVHTWQQQLNKINGNQITLMIGLHICQSHQSKQEEAQIGEQVCLLSIMSLTWWVKVGCQLATSSRLDMELE